MATTVIKGFDDLLTDLALTDPQKNTASTRITGIRDFFAGRFVTAEKPLAIGSYARSTLIRWERDIDLIAPLSVNEYWEHYKDNSRDFLYWVRKALNDEYATTEVSSREVAALLDFTVIRCHVVPAFKRTGGGSLNPNGKGGWQPTNPPHQQQFMNEANEAHSGKLKPLIKLMKAWKIENELSVSSFHMELLVEHIWRNGTAGNWPSTVAATLPHLSTWMQFSFTDPWASDGFVDSQLSEADRDAARETAEADATSSAAAETARNEGRTQDALKEWSTVCRKKFPAYG
jgi:hypothetical protein